VKKCFPTRPKRTHPNVCVFTYVSAYKAVNIRRVNKASEELRTSLGYTPKLSNNKRWAKRGKRGGFLRVSLGESRPRAERVGGLWGYQ